jgi:hypothetical protein
MVVLQWAAIQRWPDASPEVALRPGFYHALPQIYGQFNAEKPAFHRFEAINSNFGLTSTGIYGQHDPCLFRLHRSSEFLLHDHLIPSPAGK